MRHHHTVQPFVELLCLTGLVHTAMSTNVVARYAIDNDITPAPSSHAAADKLIAVLPVPPSTAMGCPSNVLRLCDDFFGAMRFTADKNVALAS